MHNPEEHRMPEALERVARRLREDRSQLGALDLDRMKTRVMAHARIRQPKGAALRGRIVVALLALGLMGTGAGGVMAGSGGSGGGASAAKSQYHPCPPPPHHHHGKPPKCKKPPKPPKPKNCPQGQESTQSGSCVPNNDGDGEGKADTDGQDE